MLASQDNTFVGSSMTPLRLRMSKESSEASFSQQQISNRRGIATANLPAVKATTHYRTNKLISSDDGLDSKAKPATRQVSKPREQ